MQLHADHDASRRQSNLMILITSFSSDEGCGDMLKKREKKKSKQDRCVVGMKGMRTHHDAHRQAKEIGMIKRQRSESRLT